ncbi:transporter substrate-binding domain-containing protein [Pseudomonas sp. Fl5BN2]|uniref:transporter substrate-binding domain-containing protein n=1 Tax=Pseudomonas sp. Fl5BN2 TaxID=2697652 RepID=UPI0013770435|nr:transporter substrate-binding domain-containing protein [Pseudomonas sp. Fl5BN2]NBF06151.1 transporter substrate-binding domain-containing protein [Pseudomonas sp. Fl5BN2]
MHSRLIWLFICLAIMGAQPAKAQTLTMPDTLYSMVRLDHHDLALKDEDWSWLRHKSELKIGAVATESPPFNVSYNDSHYEGITADVSALIGQMLGVRIKVVPFATQEKAMQALQAGNIDLLGSHTSKQLTDSIRLSRPFAEGRLALFKRNGELPNLPSSLAGLRVSVVKEHAAELQSQLPQAHLLIYPTHDEAIAAAAFGHADIYVDDVLSAYFRINRSYYGFLKFERFADFSKGGYGYAVMSDNQRLQRILDQSIDAIGKEKLVNLTRRWVGSGFIPSDQRIALTQEESRWIARHPVVRLVINDDLAPIAFFDANGVFSGVSAELLEVIAQRTGLRFQVTARNGGYPEQIEALQKSEADLAIMTASAKREESLRFTRPFLTSPFVLVTQTDSQGKAQPAGDLIGKRLAIPTGHVTLQHVRELYPKTEVIEAGASLDAMNRVYAGSADAAVVSLPASRYYIVRLFQNRLAIADLIHTSQATANFALRRGDSELQSILDKALLSLPADDLNAIASHWRSPPGMSSETWRDYALMIAEIIAGASLLLLLLLVWVFNLRRRVKAEKTLNDQLRFIETLAENMPPALYIRDIDGKMLSCNRSYLQSVGLNAKQVLNKTVQQLPSEHFVAEPDLHQNYLQAITNGQTITSVYAVQLQGKEAWIEHWIQPFQDANGVNKGVICGWLDITKHRHLVQELKEAKNLADEASRAKTTFLATMSHEIRTPMNAIIGILELALKRAGSDQIEPSSIEIAYSSAKSLLELIGDILDIARIESGRLSLSPKRANLRELVESVARVFEGLARQKCLSLILEIDSSINGDVLVDGMRFKQILSNLVSNAIKFTEAGFIRITITGDLLEGSLLRVKLSVEDSGIGISPNSQKRLFQPFAQVERNVQNIEGTGLGLVICRSLCEMMGGEVTMSSSLGHGTRVDVELRLQMLERIATVERPLQVKKRHMYRLQILVVDDHSVNRQVLHQQLCFLGHDVVEAGNGLDALNIWREQDFDMVITDCHMPIMNGAELARAIRQDERDNASEPMMIIGLTADAQPEEVERCIQAGMNDCLVKPISLDELEERLLSMGQVDDDDREHLPPPAQTSARSPQVFDLESLHTLVGSEPTTLNHILSELLSNNRTDLQTLTSLLQEQSTAELAELAHRIKGAARMVKGEQLVESCRQLEDACLSPDLSLLVVTECVEQVKQAIETLEQHLLEQHQISEEPSTQ